MDTHHFRDQLSIDTPEQVALAFPIAGLGSRLLAHLVDTLIQTGFYLVLILIAAFTVARKIGAAMQHVSDHQANWLLAGFVFINFLLLWGYYTISEAVWDGQTPGKKLLHLRVIKDSGRQITLFESMARNFVRFVDYLPTLYIVGTISILVTRENKRLGDLLAGTIVVRTEDIASGSITQSHRTITAAPIAFTTRVTATDFGIEFPPDALAKLSNADLVLIESFFGRIPDLDAPTTDRIAAQMLAAMCHKMGVAVPSTPSPRKCLDSIGYALRGVAAYR